MEEERKKEIEKRQNKEMKKLTESYPRDAK